MIGRKQEINLQINQILDGALIAFAFWLSWVIVSSFKTIPALDSMFWLMAIIVPFTPVVLEFQGYYDHPLQKTIGKSLRQMMNALLIIGVVIGAAVVFFKTDPGSRLVLLLLVLIGGGMLLAKESFMRSYLRQRAKGDGWKERILIAGLPEDTKKLRDSFDVGTLHSMEIVDEIDISVEPLERLIDCLHRHSVERVLFAVGHVHFGKVEEAVNACELEGVESWLSADFIKTSIARPAFDTLGGRLMMVFRSTPDLCWQLLAKGVMDRVLAAIALILSFPAWIFVFIGIKLTSPGPVLFRQLRSGKHGQPFSMFKFRTMHADAESRREELQAQNQMSGPVFKVENDPRIFKFGKFLRKTSIDEIPQFLNVLLGHMSLVGPRPLPTYEVEQIEYLSQRQRLSMKPGITCLWQVMGRNRITKFEDWVALDLKYIDNWSLWLDIKILLRTVIVVLFGWGAK